MPLGRRTVGILYETGVAGPYESIEFRRLPVDGLQGAVTGPTG